MYSHFNDHFNTYMTNIAKLHEKLSQLKNDITHYKLDTPEVANVINTLENKIVELEENEKSSVLGSMKEIQEVIDLRKKELRELALKKISLENEIYRLNDQLQTACRHWEVTRYNDFDGHNTHRYYVCNTCKKDMHSIGPESKVTENAYSG